MALKRFTPRDTPIPSVPSLKCHHLPMLLFSLSFAAWTLGITSFSHDFPFVTCGIYIGWWFHRFVHHNADGRCVCVCVWVGVSPDALRRSSLSAHVFPGDR